MRKISLIVIHCSATRVDRDFTAKDVDTAHRYRGFSCWGYHYYIRKSGEVEPMRMRIQRERMREAIMRLVWECATKADWMRTVRLRIHVHPVRKRRYIIW